VHSTLKDHFGDVELHNEAKVHSITKTGSGQSDRLQELSVENEKLKAESDRLRGENSSLRAEIVKLSEEINVASSEIKALHEKHVENRLTSRAEISKLEAELRDAQRAKSTESKSEEVNQARLEEVELNYKRDVQNLQNMYIAALEKKSPDRVVQFKSDIQNLGTSASTDRLYGASGTLSETGSSLDVCTYSSF